MFVATDFSLIEAVTLAFMPHPNPDCCGTDAAEEERVNVIVGRLIEMYRDGKNIIAQANNLALAYDYETLCTGYRRFEDQRAPLGSKVLWSHLRTVFYSATERQIKAETAFRG